MFKWLRKRWEVQLYIRGKREDWWGQKFWIYSSAVNLVGDLQENLKNHNISPSDFRIVDLQTNREVTPKMIKEGYK